MVNDREVVEIKIYNESSNTNPVYAKKGDAGMDIMSMQDVFVAAGDTLLIHTGIYLGIPYGWEVQVRPRSGLSLKTKLRIGNAPGTVDGNYTGEVCVIIDNIGKTDTTITKGERIAQLVAKRVPEVNWNPVSSKELLGETNRGSMGFGSTGTH